MSLKSLSTILKFAKESDLTLIGPGMSQNAETVQLIWEVIFKSSKNIMITSNAINALLVGFELLKKNGSSLTKFTDQRNSKKKNTVLVLTPQELIKILRVLEYEDINLTMLSNNKAKYLNEVALKLGWLIVLIDSDIYVASKDKLILTEVRNTSGHQNVLIGIVSAFLSQNEKKPLEAITTAIYIFKISINQVKISTNPQQISNTGIIKNIPAALKEAEKEI